ncbi:DUF2184 domain-containing protein [Vibrio phage vB_VpP_1]|nr:DUF2184 domain-containing protein [Vibrio phage vB_VpP_1]
MKVTNFDANPAAALSFLQQQAAYIETEIYKTEYPQYKYTSLVDIETSAGEWAKTVIFQAMDGRGKLKFFGPASTDVPTVDIAMKQGMHNIQTAALGYTYTLEELNYAAMNRVNLDSERATLVRDVVEGNLNEIALLGSTDVGTDGLFNSAAVSKETAAKTIAVLISEIPTNGAQPIIDLVGNAISKVYVDNTNTVHYPNRVGFPTTQFTKLNTTLLDPKNASNATVLTLLKQTFPGVEFFDDINLKTAGAGKATRMAVYKKDKRVVKFHLPMPLKFLAPATADNINFKVPGMVRTGGTEWRIPKAAHYVDGI